MSLRDWFVPTISFAMFVYFMVFVIMYAVKIGGSNVSFYDPSKGGQKEQVADPERHLQEISKEVIKRIER